MEPAEKLSRRVRRTYTDEDSGEQKTLVHEEPLKRRPPREAKSAEPFALCFPEGMRRLALMGLTQSQWEVLTHLVGVMGFEEPFPASPTKIGNAIGMDRRNVANCLAALRRHGILIDMPKRTVYIHPDFWWRGSLPNRVVLLRHLAKAEKNRAADAAIRDGDPAAPSLFRSIRFTPTEGASS